MSDWAASPERTVLEGRVKPEHLEIARRSPLLSGLPPALSDMVIAGAHARRFERGGTIFLQGEKATAVYIVADGWVKLYRIAPSGAEAVVEVLTRGRSFAEAVAFRREVYPVSAEAATDCTLIRIESDGILRLIERSPEFAAALLAATFSHLHSLVTQVQSLKAQSGAQRVAAFLLDLSECKGSACTVTLPYDKVLIAGRLGMKPESLSRAFARLKPLGVTVRQNHAEIADIEALRAFTLEDPALSWTRGR